MRKRWRYTWGTGWIVPVCFMWFIAGLPATFVLLAVDPDKNGGIARPALLWFLGVWTGPLVLVVCGSLLYGLAMVFSWVWKNPPFKRSLENVEDMREAYRMGSHKQEKG